MGFWKRLGNGLKKVAPIAVALTPTPIDDIAFNLTKQILASSPDEQANTLRILITESIRKVNPGLSEAALALAASEVLALIKRKVEP